MEYPEQIDNYDVDIFNGNFLELYLREETSAQNLREETERAKAAEKRNADNISAESDRAQKKEQSIESSLATESQNLRELIDTKIADLINGAPSTLDTLGEIAQAMQNNESVVSALDEAIGKKANASELDSHVKDKANPHGVTKEQIGLGNVDNTPDSAKNVATSNKLNSIDTRNDNRTPASYMSDGIGIITEFKSASAIGLSADKNYVQLTTFITWSDSSGERPAQIATGTSGLYYRIGTTDEAWGSWIKLSNDYNDLINKPAIPTIPSSLPANGGHASTADTATKAVQDKDGRNIVDAYSRISGTYTLNEDRGAKRYFHLFTIRPTIAYVTDQYVFEVAQRERNICTVIISLESGADMYMAASVKYHGNSIGGSIRAYEYRNTSTGKTTVEVYFVIGGWQHVAFFPRLSHFRCVSLEWNISEVGALPTDATREVFASHLNWDGSADAVDGYHASNSHSEANTCVVRDSSGFVNLSYINCNSPVNEQSEISQVITTNGSDNYYRKVSVHRMKAAIGLGNVDNTADSAKSVKYASSAGSVAYSNVSGRPTFSLSGTTLTINF